MKFTLLLLFVFGWFAIFCQFDIQNRETAKGTFLAYVSPISSRADIRRLQKVINYEGFDISITEVEFSKNGKLRSFHIEFSNKCSDSPFHYSGTLDFNKKGEYPLAVIFTGDDCSTGVFTTTYNHMKNMFDIFFKDRNPEFTFYGWNGKLDMIKDISWKIIE